MSSLYVILLYNLFITIWCKDNKQIFTYLLDKSIINKIRQISVLLGWDLPKTKLTFMLSRSGSLVVIESTQSEPSLEIFCFNECQTTQVFTQTVG